MTTADVATTVYLVQGEDPGLLSQALSALIGELSEGDGGLSAIEEYGEAGKTESRRDESSPLGPVLEACRTLPFLAPRRIVVLRDTTCSIQLRSKRSSPISPTRSTRPPSCSSIPESLRRQRS